MFVSNKSKVSSSRCGDKISGTYGDQLIEIDSMSIDFTCAFPTANSSLRSFLYKQVATVTEVNVATLAHNGIPGKSDTFKGYSTVNSIGFTLAPSGLNQMRRGRHIYR